MLDKSKKILITSALPYVNNIPHLGNIIGCVLSADVFARFCRSSGFETLFVCGSDEHGTATETKAKEEGLSPKELCDKYYSIHKDVYDWFDISFDVFGRSSEDNHHKITRDIFKKVNDNGFVEEKVVVQPFCKECDSFLADRFIEGTCPFCKSESARGDQCDSCGKLLSPQDLIDPVCKIHNTVPEFRKTNHLFLQLDKLQSVLESWVDKQSVEGDWSINSIRTTKAWFKEGLKPRAISRDLNWGIKIPESAFDGKFKDKVFYVWFDAPIAYISITEQLLGNKYKDWWFDPENTNLYQFMGKDNIPFHSIIFPATLLAADNISDASKLDNSKYTLVHHLAVTEYLNYENTKFSKSRGIGVFGNNAKDSGIPADIFRFVLLHNRPESSDTQFTWKDFQERLNNELVANFGNLVNRTISFTNRFLDNNIAEITKADLNDSMSEFFDNYVEEVKKYKILLEKVKLREALSQFMKISSLGNKYFQDNEPWKTRTINKNKCELDLALLANIIKDLAIMIEPYMPDTSKQIFKQLNIEKRDFSDLFNLSVGHNKINEASVLFKKLDDKEVEVLREKYGGQKDAYGGQKDSSNSSLVDGVKSKSKKEQNKDSKNNSKKDSKKEKKPVEALISSDVEILVGEIVEINKHSKADKLFVEKVDIGKETIQIVSGLVPYYSESDLLHKKVLVVRNLKEAKLRGELSQGMILAAEDKKGVVGILTAPEAQLGERVLAGMDASPKEEISFDEFLTLNFSLENGVSFLNNGELEVSKGKVVADKIIDGDIS